MTLTGSGGNATVDTAGYTVTFSGSLSGPGGLTKTDSGTLVLATSNTYTGDTLISGGTLQLTDAKALQNSTLNISGSGSLNFSGLAAATLGGLKGSGNLSLTNTANAAVALTAGGDNCSTSYTGALSGSGSLTKTGTGAGASRIEQLQRRHHGGRRPPPVQWEYHRSRQRDRHHQQRRRRGPGFDRHLQHRCRLAGQRQDRHRFLGSVGADCRKRYRDDQHEHQLRQPEPGRQRQRHLQRRLRAQRHHLSPGRRRWKAHVHPFHHGATSLNVSGPGTVVLTGTNKYTGGTTVSGGTLDFAGPAATPSTGIVTVKAGGYVVLGALVTAPASAENSDDPAPSDTALSDAPAATDMFSGTSSRADDGVLLGVVGSMANSDAAAVPEPGTIVMLAVGVLGFVCRRRQRRPARRRESGSRPIPRPWPRSTTPSWHSDRIPRTG